LKLENVLRSRPCQKVFEYTQLEVDTKLGISLFDITAQIDECVAKVGPRGRYCSPRHRVPFNSINEGSKAYR